MIDTIKMFLDYSVYDRQVIEGLLSNKITQTKLNGFGELTGVFKGFRVTGQYNGVKIEGSLPKHFYGNNFQTLQRSDFERAIHKLSSDIGIDLLDAYIRRVDLANNFIVKNKVNSYFGYFIKCHKYQRVEETNTLYFRNNTIRKGKAVPNRALLFYDKIEWAKQYNEIIPTIWIGKHILRYEYRLLNTQSIERALGVKKIAVKHLIERELYERLVCKYVDEFNSVEIISMNNEPNMEKIKTPKDIVDSAFAYLLADKNNLDKFTAYVSQCKMNMTDKKSTYRIKGMIDKTLQYQKSMLPSEVQSIKREINNIKISCR